MPVVDLLVLGRLLVLVEGLLPLRVVQRRQRADDRLPFDDRQARVREPRDAADDDHREHQRAADEQPGRDRAHRRGARAPATIGTASRSCRRILPCARGTTRDFDRAKPRERSRGPDLSLMRINSPSARRP